MCPPIPEGLRHAVRVPRRARDFQNRIVQQPALLLAAVVCELCLLLARVPPETDPPAVQEAQGRQVAGLRCRDEGTGVDPASSVQEVLETLQLFGPHSPSRGSVEGLEIEEERSLSQPAGDKQLDAVQKAGLHNDFQSEVRHWAAALD